MEENIGTMVAQVARLIRRSFDERARGIGVTRPQWQVLSLLIRHEGINQGGLADILEVEPITLGRMIDRLQEADLVERRPDPADRRAWRLFITAKGTALFAQLIPYANETFEIALEGIAESDRDKLMDMLLRIRSNLTRKTPLEPLPGAVRSA
jgi:DNA-binding MarR family transcriptional regulator